MEAFYSSLSPVQKVFLFCALVGGIIFVIRMVLMVVGLSDHDVHDGGLDHVDGHGDSDVSFKLFSLHGLTCFFMMFGLVGLGLSRQFWVPDIIAAAIGTVAGLFTFWVIAKLFSSMTKLQSDGTLKLSNAIGQQGKVYLTIPADGTGQVQVAFQGRLMIYDAISANKEEIKTGDQIVVIDIAGGNILVVDQS
jgi:membrane protein implicated in regulation of membrane protease activity